jgi:hypothetical protein
MGSTLFVPIAFLKVIEKTQKNTPIVGLGDF